MNIFESAGCSLRRLAGNVSDAGPTSPRRPRPAPARRVAERMRAGAIRPIVSRLGCIVVRRIVDSRGVQWTVRELAADAPQRALGGTPEVILIFRPNVQTRRPEAREVGRPLEALNGEDLLRLLEGPIGRRRSAWPDSL